MSKPSLLSCLTGIVFFVMTWTTAMAHVSHIEPQAARNQTTCSVLGQIAPEFCNPDTPEGSPKEDFSFEHPFVMPPTFGVNFFHHEEEHHDEEAPPEEEHHDEEAPPEEFVPGLGPNIEISKAIHAYLSPDAYGFGNGDVDWFKFVLDEDELSFPERSSSGVTIAQGTALVSANAIPWRCDRYKTRLPTIALIGPGLPMVDPLDLAALPFEVQDALTSQEAIMNGWGIVVSEDSNPHPLPRSSSDFHNGINTEWWGGNPNVTFFDGGPFSRFRGSLADGAALSIAGTYHLAVWDQHGAGLDYTLSTGFWEQPTEAEDIVGDANRLLFDNDMLLDFQCQDPCDGVEDGLPSQDELNDIANPEGGICGPIREV